jgi:hypothetical protein
VGTVFLQAFGGGLVIYNLAAVATKDFGDHQSPIQWVGVVFVAVGTALWRSIGKRCRPPSKVLMLGAGFGGVGLSISAIIGMAALADRMPLQSRDVSAISIGLPDHEKTSMTGNYAAGGLNVGGVLGRSEVISISWLRARGASPEAFDETLREIMERVDPEFQMLESLEVPVGEQIESQTRKLVIKGKPWLATGFICGGRQFIVSYLGGSSARSEAMHRRVLASVRCHPDPIQEEQESSISLPAQLSPGSLGSRPLQLRPPDFIR